MIMIMMIIIIITIQIITAIKDAEPTRETPRIVRRRAAAGKRKAKDELHVSNSHGTTSVQSK